MKKLMKKLAAISLATILAVSLTACGQKELSPSEARDKLKDDEIAKLVPVSEAFSEESVWFYYGYADKDKTVTKDDDIRGGILHFDGKENVTFYEFNSGKNTLTFGKLKDLSDDEIIETAKQLSSELGKTPITAKFELHIKTDGTGNNTESEQLIIGDKIFNFNAALSNQTIFNDTYSGVVNMDDKWFDGCLVTQVENGHPGFILDTPDTKGIEVD